MSNWSHFWQRDFEHLARRAQVFQANAAVIRNAQAKVSGHVDRETILLALHDGRRD